jgi:UDP-N-acetylglucosamine:LPS N-acetylglucosamine transferase
MKIVLCGGGSGGHITPLLAVASELRRQNKSINLIYIGERGGKFARIAQDSKLFDELHYVSAGKLRRYHGESLAAKLLDVKTMMLNFIDIFFFFYIFNVFVGVF